MRSGAKSRLTPINLIRQVPQDRYLAGAPLHPQEGSELTTPLPDKNSSPTGLYELAKIIMQSTHDFWEQSSSQDIELGPPQVKAVTFFRLGFCYTLPMTIYDSNACQKKNQVFRKLQTCLPWWPCPLPAIQTECKKKKVVFSPDIRNKS
jgi:hypothetical protein